MAKMRRSASFTRSEIARVLRAYRDADLPPPRVVMRRDGVVFEPMSKKTGAEIREQDEPPTEEREPLIM